MRPNSFVVPVLIAAVLGFGGVMIVRDPSVVMGAAQAVFPNTPIAGCVIKGNVSVNTGERIYHMPGQRYYDETRIAPEYDEKWFCSEVEAREAGWRRSRV